MIDAILDTTLRDCLSAAVSLVLWDVTRWALLTLSLLWISWRFFVDNIPDIDVPAAASEEGKQKWTKDSPVPDKKIPCYDPCTMDLFGFVPVMSAKEVEACIESARSAQKVWAQTSFATRRRFLQILLKYTVNHQEEICRLAGKDSGKVMVDAAFGETLVTCEKIQWVCSNGERYLRPERRGTSFLMPYKRPRVEYHPVGVMGAIVPWNYPFHNFMNPLISNLFAGNALVLKVSEHASWSACHFLRVARAALRAAGGPEQLIQLCTGYGETGRALVSGGVDKLIFVGSPAIGRKVMEQASQRLTPVVLELGGKDPIVVCEDANLSTIVPIALRGCFQSCGQNCAGCERVLVRAELYDDFLRMASDIVRKLRPGSVADEAKVVYGAMCISSDPVRLQALVDEAVADGAKVFAGGKLPPANTIGQFYPPTVLADVTPKMRIAQEEVFGPIMCVFKIVSDAEAIEICNDCSFGLGSNVFSSDARRANRIASELKCGMSSINDFATTYMCQSLPFGGVKDSGFDKFAGIEGLRGCCTTKAVVEDVWPFSTNMPPPLQYPVSSKAYQFCNGLISMFYGSNLRVQASGVVKLLGAVLHSK
jgi:acyl-CoA reductase-like NAD-dependent aldehyde dehydrogenase